MTECLGDKSLCRVLMDLLHKEYTANHPSSEHLGLKRKVSKISNANEFCGILQNTLLDPEEHDVLTLKMNTRKTFIEIGDDLKISERTARRRYKSALEKIKDQI